MKKIIFGFLIVSLVLLVSGCTSNMPVCGDGECTLDEESMNNCPQDCDEINDATCTDLKKNGDETGVDCGGPCPACAPSQENSSSINITMVKNSSKKFEIGGSEYEIFLISIIGSNYDCIDNTETVIATVDNQTTKELGINRSYYLDNNVSLFIAGASENSAPDIDTVDFCLTSTNQCQETVQMNEGETRMINYSSKPYDVTIDIVSCNLKEVEEAKVRFYVNEEDSGLLTEDQIHVFSDGEILSVLDIYAFDQEDSEESYVFFNLKI